MLIFGLAMILLLASIGIIGATLARRSSAEQARDPGPTPTAFVAIVETPAPTPQTGPVTPTVRTTATARGIITPTLGPTARVTRTTTTTAALGSGQGAGARGLAGSMAIALGGTLPPIEVPVPTATQPTAAQPVPTQPAPAQPASSPPGIAQSNPPTPTPRPSGGATGGGSSSGGGAPYTPPTPTPYIAPTRQPTPTVYVQPTVVPTPTQVPLPAAILPGPGSRTYSYNLTYTQNADLTTLPQSDFAYGATYQTYTAGDAATLKAALGLTGQIEQTGDGFRITGPGTLIISNTTGSLTYTAAGAASQPQLQALASPTRAPITPITEASVTPVASTAPSTSPAPSQSPVPGRGTGTPAPSGTPTPAKLTDEAALAVAKKTMTVYGLLPIGIDAGRVTRPTADQVVVTFHPASPGSLVPQDPMVRVVLGQDGALKSFYERWPTALTAQPAILRDPNIAWAEVTTGGGYLEVDQTIPADLPANTVFRGAATVTKVSLGWAPGATGTTNYLIPLYVFEGTVTLINPPTGQPATVPFRVYVSATMQQ